jgi:hypothetical protein
VGGGQRYHSVRQETQEKQFGEDDYEFRKCYLIKFHTIFIELFLSFFYN